MSQIENFIHTPGVHCSSTCIQDLARFDGIEISEAMAFGLGEGFGFLFYEGENLSPSARFNGRAANLEDNFYRRIGQPIEWSKKWDLAVLTDALNSGRPVLAKTFLAHLPYYEPADFPGHGIIITAIDEKKEQLLVADSISESPLALSVDQFHKAIAVDCPPFMKPYSYAAAPIITFKITPSLLREAIVGAAKTMLKPPSAAEGFLGMDIAISNLPTWKEDDDWQWHARFAYQSIEKRGTGGAGLRIIFSQFLDEATAYLPELKQLKLEETVQQSIQIWQQMAQTFKLGYIDNKRSNFDEAASKLTKIREIETTLCTTIVKELA